jgi:hypothetical protein
METIEIKTLIDITKPEISRAGYGSDLEQNQFKNWTTLQQCIGLRSNIEWDNPPSVEIADIKGMGFGNRYKGEHKVWTFKFHTDRSSAYSDDDGNLIGLLLDDIDQVPIIQNLTETINISKAVFNLNNPQYRNTIITATIRQIEAQENII